MPITPHHESVPSASSASSIERYPHIYGSLPLDAVTRTRPAAVAKGWLELGPWESTTG